ncbi:MAG: SDR family NAD(P)-dependent oxidoreductase [Coxiellaceae bacterium]|nr:SDR family NAD(P)-dependent oxidoreductase [Coxiellaceae bacterium]
MPRLLITGANSGIGYALTQHFLQHGYDIVAVDINIDRLSIDGVTAVSLDLTETSMLQRWLLDLKKPFDILINCAGIREITPVLDLAYDEWQRVMQVNLTAPFLLSQAVAKLAINAKQPANIINMASISGLAVEPNRAAYCSSKHGLVGLTKQMAMDLGAHNIRVNAIAPGVVQTELTESYFNDTEQVALIKSNTPLQRWAQPQHIVQAVQSVLNNDFMTGSVLVIDGGWTVGKQL